MISFDGAAKVIVLSTGTTSLSVVDLWSRYLDWLAIGDNSKYAVAMTSLGGDTIDASSGTSVPAYVFLQNGWRVKPQNADHTLNVTTGVLLVSGGGDPFINSDTAHVIRINYSQPVQAVTVATGGGGDPATIASAVLASAIETGYDLKSAMRLVLSAMAGKVSGAQSSSIHFRNVTDTKDRIIATVDGNGNRTVMVHDTAD